MDQRRLSSVRKFLVYAPGNKHGEEHMIKILKKLFISSDHLKRTGKGDSIGELNNLLSLWTLLPMASTDSNQDLSKNLLSSDLGSKLSDALSRVRRMLENNGEDTFNGGGIESIVEKTTDNFGGPVVFLGMDSPELPIDEICSAIQIATSSKKAYLNPAHDGGYGMLCVPSQAPTCIFENVQWSTSLTALSQLKALSDNRIDTVIGSFMNDIDETRDVKAFAGRLCQVYSYPKEENHNFERENSQGCGNDRLSQESKYTYESFSRDDTKRVCPEIGTTRNANRQIKCQKSFRTLLEMGFIRRMDTDNEEEASYVLNF